MRLYNVVSFLLSLVSFAGFLVLLLLFLSFKREARVDELTTKRLNVVEKDGTLRFVLANRDRFPGPTLGGIEHSKEVREMPLPVAGMIFYNDQGDEMGGIVWGGGKKEDDKIKQLALIAIDAYRQNEVFSIGALEEDGKRKVLMACWDRPHDPQGFEWVLKKSEEALQYKEKDRERYEKIKKEIDQYIEKHKGEWEVPRFFFVKNDDGSVGIRIGDRKGRERIKIEVDPEGNPSILLLDSRGKVVASLPEK